jgi:leader peptidase (prepilin peptidase)/N-methyltransferase
MIDLAEILASTPWLLAACVFVLSLLIGSFLNVVIHRLPIMLEREWKTQAREVLAESTPVGEHGTPAHQADVLASAPIERYNLLVPRSRCPKCNAEITAAQNIPVVSWLVLGGRCAACKAPISPRYPIVELATAVLSAAVAWHFGWGWQTAAALCFTWALVALTVIDLDHQILPDIVTLPLLWIGLLLSLAWQPGLRPPTPVDPASAIVGAAAGYLSLWLVYWTFRLATGKEGMGYGDFKLFGALGAWLGWQMLPLIILVSAFAGAVIGLVLIAARGRDRNIPIPFGPYLAAAGWIALMWGPQIVGGYLSYSGLDR